MIRTRATALLALSLTASGAFATSLDDLVFEGGLAYKKFPGVPFTGKVDEGSQRGAFKNGEREGPWVQYNDDARIYWKGEYKNGKFEGPWIMYYDDGTKDKDDSGTYRDGKKVSD